MSLRLPSILALLTVCVGAWLALSGRAEAVQMPQIPTDPCASAIQRAERVKGIPSHLLRAISLGESGRWDPEHKAKVAWPWTINAEGQGFFFPSKAAAIAKVRELRAQGVKSIDVGCMQINLIYHGFAFDNLDEAFDPEHNVAYSAAFLWDLKRDKKSWTLAVGYYHSANPKFNQPYRAGILKTWRELRQADPTLARTSAETMPDDVPVEAKADAPRKLDGARPFMVLRPAFFQNASGMAVTSGAGAVLGQHDQGLSSYRDRPVSVAPRPLPGYTAAGRGTQNSFVRSAPQAVP